jgi:hypothetical protein
MNSCTAYIASSFDLTDRVEKVYQALTDAGYEVPDIWWHRDLKGIGLPDEEWYQHPYVVTIANRHWNSIENVDVFVLVAPEEQPKKYNGANIELGYALGNGLDCYAVGELERSAMYEPVTRLDSVEELVDELRGAQQLDKRDGGDGIA